MDQRSRLAQVLERMKSVSLHHCMSILHRSGSTFVIRVVVRLGVACVDQMNTKNPKETRKRNEKHARAINFVKNPMFFRADVSFRLLHFVSLFVFLGSIFEPFVLGRHLSCLPIPIKTALFFLHLFYCILQFVLLFESN